MAIQSTLDGWQQSQNVEKISIPNHQHHHQHLRAAATLLFVGLLLTFGAGLFHADRAPANDHVAAFTDYAASSVWTMVHLGQFVGMTVMMAGLFLLGFAMDTHTGALGWASRLGAIGAVVTLMFYGVLQAVDGVALKQAVDAWAAAPDAEKLTLFASAQAIRWLEWGVRSYQSFMLGLTLLLFGSVIVGTAKPPRLIGYLMGLCGLAYIAQGWIIGTEGFSAHNTLPTLLGYLLWLVWSSWLLVIGWRASKPVGQ